jgi:hypothetical protein
VIDASGTVLAARSVAPVAPDTETDGSEASHLFTVLVPQVAGAASIVVRSDGNAVIGTLTLGGAAPLVQLVAPAGPAALTGEMLLTWTITDADSTAHTTRVTYSSNNGATWSDLGDVETRDLIVDFDKLPGGAATLIRLMVSDGVNSTTSTFGPFTTLKKRDVTAKILSPAADVVVAPGMLYFDGFGLDIDDGSLTGAALAWRSDVAGPIGTGEQVTSVIESL